MRQSPAEMRDTFDRDGFLIVPNLLDRDETKRLKEECRGILEEARANAAKRGEDPKNVIRNGVYVGLAARSDLFREAVADPRILDILEAIYSPNIEFLSDKFVFKNEDTDFDSPWHQDWHYWGGANKISIWIPFDDARVENGTLKLLPGSHKGVVVHDGKDDEGIGFGHRLRRGVVDENLAVTAIADAGAAVFFSDLTLHASHPNIVRADRWVWIPTYRDALLDDPKYPWAVAAKVLRGQGRAETAS